MKILEYITAQYKSLLIEKPKYSISDAEAINNVLRGFREQISETSQLLSMMAAEIIKRDKSIITLINSQSAAILAQTNKDKGAVLNEIKSMNVAIREEINQSNELLSNKIKELQGKNNTKGEIKFSNLKINGRTNGKANGNGAIELQ